MYNDTMIIAEVKPKSPNFVSEKSWDELFEIAVSVGDWISIHTHEWWGGSFELIAKARSRTKKPILAKGFHETDEDVKRALLMGADYVLMVGRMPNIHQDKCLIEPYTVEELLKIPDGLKCVWNSRDMRALISGRKESPRKSFEDVRVLCPDVWLCQASNLKTAQDISKGADAVLVGTNLETFAQSLCS